MVNNAKELAMAISEELREMFEDKDYQIDALENEVRELREAVKGKYDWLLHREGEEGELPVPRLEIRWEEEDLYRSVARYDLVKRHHLGHLDRIPLGCTKTGSIEKGLELPFRDGVHIKADMKHLGLPGYVVNQKTGKHRKVNP